ncbi:hypothetical protein Atai01_09340 [Amycolatopsis taiwanensis]|uniref:Uncharacterized protein n=1 Tax=Amycolatopsis taiwanensis TaxID=342230 RepID=A0A9W6QYI6_9PSEU|nr:hypothetical protein Atai01_09340 [Amycolatopsis taiwanensis]
MKEGGIFAAISSGLCWLIQRERAHEGVGEFLHHVVVLLDEVAVQVQRGRRIEGSLGVGDEEAHPGPRAGVLADDRADQGEAERGVQGRQDPRRGARQHDRAQHLQPSRAQDPRVAIRLRSTSRAPVNALKNTAKTLLVVAGNRVLVVNSRLVTRDEEDLGSVLTLY